MTVVYSKSRDAKTSNLPRFQLLALYCLQMWLKPGRTQNMCISQESGHSADFWEPKAPRIRFLLNSLLDTSSPLNSCHTLVHIMLGDISASYSYRHHVLLHTTSVANKRSTTPCFRRERCDSNIQNMALCLMAGDRNRRQPRRRHRMHPPPQPRSRLSTSAYEIPKCRTASFPPLSLTLSQDEWG
ncbi:hypothetical protein BJ165DRAFT_231214 [Panaeolus papilionaceus]|nr:hypothetical protein BJ165DRAFT_231214 [Panaeolus papilionaceus]